MAKITTIQLKAITDRLHWATNDVSACVNARERVGALTRLDAVIREAVELRKQPTRANVDPFYPDHVDSSIASANVLLARTLAKDAPACFELKAPEAVQ